MKVIPIQQKNFIILMELLNRRENTGLTERQRRTLIIIMKVMNTNFHMNTIGIGTKSLPGKVGNHIYILPALKEGAIRIGEAVEARVGPFIISKPLFDIWMRSMPGYKEKVMN
ncbi:hypothetical protein [Ruminiclostridium hungatei]|uniref:hypothetical protein n=1 Tax=Ruminiclostridium hungatei TaxID=48256 RepID=UPI0009AC532C|nr:hypothetical protein [Ruminiclostridium hungatei]